MTSKQKFKNNLKEKNFWWALMWARKAAEKRANSCKNREKPGKDSHSARVTKGKEQVGRKAQVVENGSPGRGVGNALPRSEESGGTTQQHGEVQVSQNRRTEETPPERE